MNSKRMIRIGVIAVFALVSILAPLAFAAPAQAAVVCRAYHTVVEGDRTPTIAHTYGLRWREIAKANNLEDMEKLIVGTVLCIPSDDAITNQNKPKTTLIAYTVNHRLTLTASGGDHKYVYIVKVRDLTSGVGSWEKIGRLKVNKKSTATASFTIPDKFKSAIYLEVCLKNQTTDEKICRTVLRRYY